MSRYTIAFILLVTVAFSGVGLFNNSGKLCAQRRRRTSQKIIKSKKKGTADRGQVNISQIEERNRELLRQIINLQTERDFYKKKLLDWSEAKKEGIEKPKTEIYETVKKPELQKMPDLLPIKAIVDSLLSRSAQLKTKISYEDSLFYKAQRFTKLGSYDKAIETYGLLIKSKASKDIHRFHYGILLYKLCNYDEAIKVLSNITESDSLISIASFYKGRIYQESGMEQTARIEFIRCRVLNPSFPGYSIGLGLKLIKNGQLDSAEVLLRSQLNKSRELNTEIFAGMANIQKMRGDRLKAISLYQKSLAYDPDYMKNNFILGYLLLEEKQYQSSILFLTKSLKYNYKKENYHLYLGKALYYLRRWDQALAQFLKIDEELWGKDDKAFWVSKTYYLKSLVAHKDGNFYEATNLFRRAKEWNPDAYSWMSAALQDLGKIYENEASYNDALKYYSQLIRLNTSDPQTMLKLGTLYYQNGDLDEAKTAFIKASRFEETETQAKYWLDRISYSNE